MATETQTREQPQTRQPAPQRAQEVAVSQLRIPYRPSAHSYGINSDQWETLVNAIYPAAKTAEGVMLAIAYCKSRNLDIFKRPVHIVPMNTKKKTPDGKEVWITIETIWPGISELRTTAFRTGKYAGCDPAVFGPDKTHRWEIAAKSDDSGDDHPNAPPSEKKAAGPKIVNVVELMFPEWCQITVYRLVDGQRVAFPGPRVYWLEAYATTSRFNDAPNEMWKDRCRGQLEKCSEASALRKAFPEELGGEYTIDEAPRMVDVTPSQQTTEMPTVRPEKPPASSVADTPAGRAARARQQATDVEPEKVTTPKPESSTETVDPSTGEVKTSTDAGPPEMSEALEDALGKLARLYDPAEIDGARAYLKKELSADDFAVWQTASLQQQRRVSQKR